MMPLRCLLFLLALASAALAQNKDSVITDGGAPHPAFTPLLRHPLQYRTPGHGILDGLCGPWDITATLWLNGPAQPPVTGAGGGGWNSILGGRFLRIADSLTVGGRTLRLAGYMGWEEARQHLELVLLTDTGADMWLATGTKDSTWRNFTFTGTDANARPLRLALQVVNGNYYRLEAFITSRDGREYKLLKAEYRRTLITPKRAG